MHPRVDVTSDTVVTSEATDDGWITAHIGAAGYRTQVGVRRWSEAFGSSQRV